VTIEHGNGRRGWCDVVCLSHLRWDFVWQRPQHLLSRCARERRVFFVEEPLRGADRARLEVTPRAENLFVCVPRLPDRADATVESRRLLEELVREHALRDYVLWFSTPMALPLTERLAPRAVVYDCMDELSAFLDAPAELVGLEGELLARADLVFTGGRSLYEAKRHRHPRVHLFPSSIDTAHFATARAAHDDPPDQASIGRPRLGFFGVIDERMDVELLSGVAALRPEWQLVLLGPVAKIDEAVLPRRSNIHYLGIKTYDELPAYVAGWDAAILPFARNEATRFLSPTKTPEYLAAGRPVVSTGIADVIDPYGNRGLVEIADDAEAFVAAAERAMGANGARLRAVDAFLTESSWDYT
jgi:glycosyltransferase involved in cell wall biosynthesis